MYVDLLLNKVASMLSAVAFATVNLTVSSVGFVARSLSLKFSSARCSKG